MTNFPFPKVNEDQMLTVANNTQDWHSFKIEGNPGPLLPKLTYHSSTQNTMFFLYLEKDDDLIIPWAVAISSDGDTTRWVVGSDKETATRGSFFPLQLMDYCIEFLKDVQYFVNHETYPKGRVEG